MMGGAAVSTRPLRDSGLVVLAGHKPPKPRQVRASSSRISTVLAHLNPAGVRALGAFRGSASGVNTGISCDMAKGFLRCNVAFDQKAKPARDPGKECVSCLVRVLDDWRWSALELLYARSLTVSGPRGKGGTSAIGLRMKLRGRSCLLGRKTSPGPRIGSCNRNPARSRPLVSGPPETSSVSSGERRSISSRPVGNPHEALLPGRPRMPGPRPDLFDWKGASDEPLIGYVEYQHLSVLREALPDSDDGVYPGTGLRRRTSRASPRFGSDSRPTRLRPSGAGSRRNRGPNGFAPNLGPRVVTSPIDQERVLRPFPAVPDGRSRSRSRKSPSSIRAC